MQSYTLAQADCVCKFHSNSTCRHKGMCCY